MGNSSMRLQSALLAGMVAGFANDSPVTNNVFGVHVSKPHKPHERKQGAKEMAKRILAARKREEGEGWAR